MSSLSAIASRFRFNEQVVDRVAAGFTAADWTRRLEGGTSHAYWILGHLVASRRSLLRNLGKELEVAPWEVTFGRGSRPGQLYAGPAPRELIAELKAAGELLEQHLAAMTPEAAAAPYVRKMSDGSTTREGATRFMCWHETYHLGQLGILRKACGKPGLA
jgi:hypothetical protein